LPEPGLYAAIASSSPGHFPISGARYFEAVAAPSLPILSFSFLAPQNAFGFYGVGFSDYGPGGSGSVTPIQISLDGGPLIDVIVENPIDVPPQSVEYFGIVSSTPFSNVQFYNYGPAHDGIVLDDVVVSRFFSPDAVDISAAGPTQPAYVSSTYATAGAGQTFTYESLEVRPGATATLAPNDTLVLTGGPLYIAPGAVFNGNGVVDGDVLNAGLVRIFITGVGNISSVSGGTVQLVMPAPPAPGVPVVVDPPTFEPTVVNEGTLVTFSPADIGGGPGGGGGGGSGSGITGQSIVWNGPGMEVSGTLGLDASLEVTGSYTQTETGALRLFIAGAVHEPGNELYSVLTVGEGVTLAGSLQIVLQPDLFGYLPSFGDTFDVIRSPAGITLDPELVLLSLVTQDGAAYLAGLGVTQSPFDSGFTNDPDHLNLLDPGLWQISLVENDTILRLQFIGVPEPSSIALAAVAALTLVFCRIRRR
jgi:hypothetical protein